MATPSLTPYNTNGKVRTGRTALNGDYCNATINAKSVANGNKGELCAGWAWYSGLKTFEIKPIVTWEEYPTGIVDIPISGGNPTSAAPTAIYDSYMDNWVSGQGILTPTIPIHAPELRYYCLLYSSATRMIVWMSSGSGHDTYYTSYPPDTLTSYFPKKDFELSASFSLNVDVACHERVDIEQLTGSSSEWVWPSGCHKDGMGTTLATYDAKADTSVCSITIGSDTIESDNMPSGYIPTPAYEPFDSSRTIEGKTGLYTSTIGGFGWGQISLIGSGSYQYTNQEVYSSVTEVSSMTIGVKEMDLRFRKDQTYTGTDTNCEGNALNNSFNYKAKNSPASASGTFVGTDAKWTDLGLSFIVDVDFAMMDGAAQGDASNTEPEFTELSSNTSWTGNTSPLIVYDGSWTLKMYELDGSIMDTRSTETDASGSGASWARNNPAPAYIQVRLDNPEDYNVMARSVYNEYTEQYETLDDKRVLLPYPRESSISWSMATYTEIDSLDTIGTSGIDGWAAVNCTATTISGGLQITDVESGAYIYRSDFLTDADDRKPKHWPGHRFTKITASAVDGDSQAVDIDHLKLTVSRNVGADTFEKVYSTPCTHTDTWGIWDICHPDGTASIDTAESYIDQAKPLDTVCTGGSEGAWIIESNELSDLSDTWGIGAFDEIAIGGFDTSNTYELFGLGTLYQDETYDNVTYVQAECDKERDIGDTALNDAVEDNWQNHVWRHIIAVSNGRYAWEVPSVKVSKSPNFVVNNYSNYSLEDVFETLGNRWPADDFEVFSFTLTDAYSSGDWNETDQEYTDERVLFNKDVCPVWFCLSKGFIRAEHDNKHDQLIKIAPLYDRLTVYPSWGDGTGTTARVGYITVKGIKRVRGRINGILWTGNTFDVDTLSVESAYTESVTSDAQGYYRSGDHNRDTTLTFDSIESTISPYSRVWNRVCLTLPTGAIYLNSCSSRQCGRVYIVYTLGTSIKVRVYDFGLPGYQDRDVLSSPPQNTCGITFTAGCKAGLAVVYDQDGHIYRKESFSEGNSWSEPVSIATGTNPQICYCEKSRVEIVTYFDTDSIYAIRKLDQGDYGTPILIATSDDSPAPLTVCPGTRNYKIVCAVVQSGAIVRYVSTDDGKAWSVEE